MPFKQQIQCKIASITRKKTGVGRTWCQHWPSIKWVLYKLRLELWCSELRQKDLKNSINNDMVIVWYQCSTTNRWLDASSTLITTPSFFGRAWGRASSVERRASSVERRASSVLSFHSCIRRRHGNQKVKTNLIVTLSIDNEMARRRAEVKFSRASVLRMCDVVKTSSSLRRRHLSRFYVLVKT